jgi:hypothetical protein
MNDVSKDDATKATSVSKSYWFMGGFTAHGPGSQLSIGSPYWDGLRRLLNAERGAER